jgi:glucose-1-phosphate adenylyltransferase
VISDASIERSVIGVRSYIDSGTSMRNTIMMGADFYDVNNPAPNKTCPELGVGKNCVIDHAIIDKNARIGDGVVITPEGKPENCDGENYYVRDGIVVIPKNAIIPSGTWV